MRSSPALSLAVDIVHLSLTFLSVITKWLYPLLVITLSIKEKSHAPKGNSLQWTQCLASRKMLMNPTVLFFSHPHEGERVRERPPEGAL